MRTSRPSIRSTSASSPPTREGYTSRRAVGALVLARPHADWGSLDRMYATTRVLPEPGRVKRFDVICAGETQWKLADGPARGGLRLRPGGGAVNVSFALARE